jgi:hypothetical protein
MLTTLSSTLFTGTYKKIRLESLVPHVEKVRKLTKKIVENFNGKIHLGHRGGQCTCNLILWCLRISNVAVEKQEGITNVLFSYNYIKIMSVA